MQTNTQIKMVQGTMRHKSAGKVSSSLRNQKQKEADHDLKHSTRCRIYKCGGTATVLPNKTIISEKYAPKFSKIVFECFLGDGSTSSDQIIMQSSNIVLFAPEVFLGQLLCFESVKMPRIVKKLKRKPTSMLFNYSK